MFVVCEIKTNVVKYLSISKLLMLTYFVNKKPIQLKMMKVCGATNGEV